MTTTPLACQADAARVATRTVTVRRRQVEDHTIRANVAYNRAARRRGVPAPIRALAMADALQRCIDVAERRTS